jgi:hypothetical protein
MRGAISDNFKLIKTSVYEAASGVTVERKAEII